MESEIVLWEITSYIWVLWNTARLKSALAVSGSVGPKASTKRPLAP